MISVRLWTSFFIAVLFVTALTVSNDQTTSEMDLRVSVQNHTTWGIAAVAIIVVLCVGLGLIIRKYGRR